MEHWVYLSVKIVDIEMQAQLIHHMLQMKSGMNLKKLHKILCGDKNKF